MSRRTLYLLIALLVVVLAAAAVWLFLAARNRQGEIVTEVAGTPQAPLPTVLATAAGPEPEAIGQPGPATPSPTPAVIERPGDSPGGLNLDAPPTLDELLARYPALARLLENVDLDDREQLGDLYEQLLALHAAEGLLGLDVFLTGSGVLQALNLDPTYVDFILAYETGGIAAAEALARQRRILTDDDMVRAVLVLDTEDLSLVEPALTAAGATVLAHHGNEVEIGLPLAQIEAAADSEEALAQLVALAHLPHVITIRAPETTPTDALPPRDEGAAVTLATAWHAAGITGQGVRVGILDPDGFGGYLGLLGSELPPAERVFIPSWLDVADLDDTGPHGTACAEIVYEMAPGATLYLAYTGQSRGGLEDAVEWLIANDVDIISYSASSLVEPLDGTGPSDDLVALAQDAGVLWVNASGNYALSHLDMTFSDADGDGFHEFPHGDELLPVYTGDLASVGLSWDEAWGRSSEDYDLYLYTTDLNGELEIVTSSRALQGGRAGDLPYELIDAELSPWEDYYVAIQEDGISRPGRLNLIGWGMDFDYSMPAGSLGSPADAFGALAVGATYWRDDALEDYSSQGPTSDGRTKPDLTAPARVSSATYGEFDGTSAAAPHVAGAAALVLSAHPNLSARELRDFLTGRALDRGLPGLDNEFGAGRLDMQQPPDAAEGGVAGAPRGATIATATIDNVRLVHNQTISGIYGVVIYTDFSVTGLTEHAGTIIAHFGDDAGNPLRDGNGQFSDAGGNVAVFDTFTMTADDGRATEYPLFMPYEELELSPGEHTILVTVSIGDAAGAVLASAAPATMILRQADEAAAAATIGAVDVIHNVTSDGMAGMNILVDFDALNFRGQTGILAAYFYFDDANNTPLLDFNDQYRSADGIVSVGRRFTPGTARAEYRDLSLFIPYGELHMAEGERYDLKFNIIIWDEATGEDLVISDWVYFWFES